MNTVKEESFKQKYLRGLNASTLLNDDAYFYGLSIEPDTDSNETKDYMVAAINSIYGIKFIDLNDIVGKIDLGKSNYEMLVVIGNNYKNCSESTICAEVVTKIYQKEKYNRIIKQDEVSIITGLTNGYELNSYIHTLNLLFDKDTLTKPFIVKMFDELFDSVPKEMENEALYKLNYCNLCGDVIESICGKTSADLYRKSRGLISDSIY